MLRRDWRGGELGVLVLALVLAVGVVTGISAFTTRLQSALVQESHRFLAADAVLRSSTAMPEAWLHEAQQRGLQTAKTLLFPSMIYGAGDELVLASIKAVTAAYPLRGALRYSTGPFAAPIIAATGPAPGEVWLDSRLFALLGVVPGDSVTVGDASFRVTAAARAEPDQGASFIGLGPRVLMHFDDIPATNVVQPGSRVEYRQLIAGQPAAVKNFVQWVEPQLQPGQQVLDVEQGQPGLGSALERAEGFLLLAGSLAVALAGVAVALAARRFSERHQNYVAIMKSLGSTSGAIARLYGGSLLLLGAMTVVLGASLGWVMQALFFALFAEQLPIQPGAAGLRPYLIGGMTCLVCLVCFAWPPLRRLGRSSPLRVLRRDLPQEEQRSVFDFLVGLAAVALLMRWYSGDTRLTLAVLAGLGTTVVCGLGVAALLLKGGRLAGMRAGSIWRSALASLQRRGTANAMQVVIFAMAIMLLLVLVLVRTSLLDEWRVQLPDDASNHFIINIAPDDVAPIEALFQSRGIAREPLYPMVRGRIVAINDEPLAATDDPAVERRQRESNLTWSAQLPPDNEIVSGTWWSAQTQDRLVSVEAEYAARFELDVGDTLEFLIGAEPLTAVVASIRELQWQSMRPNFFLLFPPAALEGYPATYMSSFYLPEENKHFLNEFVRAFPTVSVIEMDIVMEQIRTIIDQVSAAIEVVLAVILAAGALVLIAGVQASVDERMRESAVLRTLGARRGLILGGLLIEFATLGFFAGLMATLAAEFSVGVLQTFAMDMQYRPTPWLWPVGPLVGMLLIGALGVFSCRRVVSTPPVAVLRELA